MDSLVWATFQVAASARCVLLHACYGCRSDRNSLKSASTPPTSVSILSVAFRLFASTDGAAQCREACARYPASWCGVLVASVLGPGPLEPRSGCPSLSGWLGSVQQLWVAVARSRPERGRACVLLTTA